MYRRAYTRRPRRPADPPSFGPTRDPDYDARLVRPNRNDIPVPPFAPGLEWVGGEPADAERLTARGPLLVVFFEAGRAQWDRRACRSRRLGPPLRRRRADDRRRPQPALGPRPLAGGVPGGDRTPRPLLPRRLRRRLPRLARVRMQGLALALPLGPRRSPALVPLRRRRHRRDRGRNPRGAGGGRCRARAAGTGQRARWAWDRGREAERRGLPRRLARQLLGRRTG